MKQHEKLRVFAKCIAITILTVYAIKLFQNNNIFEMLAMIMVTGLLMVDVLLARNKE